MRLVSPGPGASCGEFVVDASTGGQLGDRGGRTIHYAPALVDAPDLDRVAQALDGVVDASLVRS